LQEDEKDEAEIQQVQAATITTLVRDGFTADSAIKAVTNGDMNLLQHTGMVSVQLQVPGAQPAGIVERQWAAAVARPYSLSEGYMSDQTPPRENLIRAVMPGVEFRDATTEGDPLPDGVIGILRVLFSPVGEWTEINSAWEGNFLERFAEGAWKKTIRESGAKVRSLFQHGMDPQIGDKPLGPIRVLQEGADGGYGEVELLDTSYNRDLLPGLKAGLYGSSHRFAAMREVWDDNPEPSEANPKGLPERTIKEARLAEFGPVTFPAYEGATAGVRSLTDEFLMGAIRCDPLKAARCSTVPSASKTSPRTAPRRSSPRRSRTSRKTHPPAPTPRLSAPRNRSAA
jgi:HK97 family phage prohead protease